MEKQAKFLGESSYKIGHDIKACRATPSEVARIDWSPSCSIEYRNIPTNHSEELSDILFSPNGNVLASFAGGIIQLWDVATGKCQHTFGEQGNTLIAKRFRSDSSVLAASSVDGFVRIWDVATGKCLNTIQNYVDNDNVEIVESIDFSPDGQLLALAGSVHGADHDCSIHVWNANGRRCLFTLIGHDEHVASVSFSQNGRYLASGSYDHTLRIWDVKSGKCIRTLIGHTDCIQSIIFSPDSKILASSSEDNTVRLWDIDNGWCLHAIDVENTIFSAYVIFSTDGRLLATCDDSKVQIFDVANRKLLYKLDEIDMNSFAFSPDLRLFANGSITGTVRVWDIATGKCHHLLNELCGSLKTLAFSPDGRTLASGGYVGLQFWKSKL